MIRKQMYLSEKQESFLKKKSTKIGISYVELVRRIIDQYIDIEENNVKEFIVIR